MTSYTRKLHAKDPSKAVAIHRLRYGKHTTLAQFSSSSRSTFVDRNEMDEVQALVRSPRAVAHIEQDFDVTERLQRWSDRGWR